MNFICNKTKREFNTQQGFVNHLRHQFENMEVAYLKENKLTDPPTCRYCESLCKFHGFFKGYYDTCCDDSCVKKKQSVSSKRRVRVKKHRVYKNRTCKFCEDIFKIKEVENDRYYCRKKQCISMNKNNFGLSDIILTNNRDVNNTFQWFKYIKKLPNQECYDRIKEHLIDITLLNNIYSYRTLYSDKTKIWTCPITEYIIPIAPKSHTLLTHLQKFNIDIVDYYKKYLPDYITFCKKCGNLVGYSVDLVNYHRFTFCKNTCYWKWMKGKSFYTDEMKLKQSNEVKSRILSGEFTPNISNVWNGSVPIMNGKKYRSSWEAAFHHFNPDLKYEKVKIKYFCSIQHKNRVYIIDFVDYNNKILYEIKPDTFLQNQNVIDKEKYAKQWCEDNEYEFKFITNEWFHNKLNKENITEFPDDIQRKLKQFI